MTSPGLRPESLLVAAGRPEAEPDAPVNTPISASATFHGGGRRAYSRSGTDSTEAFEAAIGAVEGGLSVAFSSGMAAASALIEGLPADSTIVTPSTFYNYNRTLFDAQVALGRARLRVVDLTDTEAVLAALPGAALAWLELPTNPMLEVCDLPAIVEGARRHGVRTVLDATIATPLGLRGLALGTDVVMHSVTKWIAGHSDVLMGVLSTADPKLAAQLADRRTLTGAVPGSLEAFLALRGLRTLAVRLERACANAAVLAPRLREHPAVTSIHYLGFADHPQAGRITRLLSHGGSLISFTLAGAEQAERLCLRTRLITHATSIGGVESLIEHRGNYPGEAAQGTPPELVRLSVGIEHAEDLWRDLSDALDGATG